MVSLLFGGLAASGTAVAGGAAAAGAAGAAAGAAAAAGGLGIGAAGAALGASAAVTAAATTTLAAAYPVLTGLVGIAAGIVDSAVVSPAILGTLDDGSKSKTTFDSPVGDQAFGSPTHFALGRRVRVPCHILYQSRKIREETASTKRGSGVVQRQVFVNALIALNVRKTQRLVQLYANGRLMLWTERNLIRVSTPNMGVAWAGGTNILSITMDSLEERDLETIFRVNDIVKLRGWESANTELNDREFVVSSVSPHGNQPSLMTIVPIDGQNFAAAGSGTAGQAASPAEVIRLDDARDMREDVTFLANTNPDFLRVTLKDSATYEQWSRLFGVGNKFVIKNLVPSVDNNRYELDRKVNGETFVFRRISGTQQWTGVFSPAALGTNNDRAICTHDSSDPQITPGFFPEDYDLEAEFRDGSETQTENPILVEALGAGESSPYRGISYIGVKEFNVTQLGGALPQSMEAIIEVDSGMSLKGALQECFERAGIESRLTDFEGFTDKAFEGMYLRGAIPTASAIQPLTVAHRLLDQNRRGRIHLFDIKNADAVNLQNDAVYSDLGWDASQTNSTLVDIQVEDPAPDRLPTAVEIKYQDADLAYVSADEDHRLRSPTFARHQFTYPISMENVVMRRADAKHVCAETLRQAWINGQVWRTSLSMRWLHLLNNDIVKATDDLGVTRVGRIVNREITPDLLVQITCVETDANPEFVAWPVSRIDVDPPATFEVLSSATGHVLDIPAVTNQTNGAPGVTLLSYTSQGAPWTGVTVWMSVNGVDWNQVGVIGSRGVAGTLASPLNTGAAAEDYTTPTVTFDTTNSLVVDFDYVDGLATITDTQGINNENLVAIVDGDRVEILSVINWANNGNNQWTGTRLLRGLRGTNVEAEQYTFPAGAQVFKLDTAAFISLPQTPTSLQFKFLAPGQTLDDVTAVSKNMSWRNASPLRLRRADLTYAANNDLTVTTQNRTKHVLPVGSIGPYRMDETFEVYDFLLYDSTRTTLFETRRVSSIGSGSNSLRDKEAVFTAAELANAGYSAGATNVQVDIIQIGDFGSSLSRFL